MNQITKARNDGAARDRCGRKLRRAFFSREAEAVARGLVGAVLVRRVKGREMRARVVETEAYVGEHDLACHASKGLTKRTAIMFGKAGYAYVYFVYGMHAMLNVVTGKEGSAQAVLIRAAEAMEGVKANLTGPGNLTKGLKITVKDNGVDVTGEEIYFERGDGRKVRVEATKRIGVDYAGAWKDELLRFVDGGSGAVSGRRRKQEVTKRRSPTKK